MVQPRKHPLPKVIGLYSPVMQSGKTTVSDYLSNKYGYTPIKFATTLKLMLVVLFRDLGFADGSIQRMLEGDLKEASMPALGGNSPRRLMQTLGTDWGRNMVDTDIWIEVAKAKAEDILYRGRGVIFEDVRQPNEYTLARRLGARMIRVTRPGNPHQPKHGCEGQLDGHIFDEEIVNDGTIFDLHETVENLFT